MQHQFNTADCFQQYAQPAIIGMFQQKVGGVLFFYLTVDGEEKKNINVAERWIGDSVTDRI